MQKRLKGFIESVRKKRAATRQTGERLKRRQAFLAVSAARARKIAGAKKGQKPFLVESQEKLFPRLRERILPKKPPVHAESKKKQALMHELFDAKNKGLGLIVIKPSAIELTIPVRSFLHKLGCRIVHSKPFVFSKAQVGTLYWHAIEGYPSFSVHAANLRSGPARLIVFKHVPLTRYILQSEYLQHLKQSNPEEYSRKTQWLLREKSAQSVFCDLFKGSFSEKHPGTIRTEIVVPELKRAGFSKHAVKGEAQQIDALGFVESMTRQGKGNVVTQVFAGIHVPNYAELFKDANVLLTLEELKAIKRRL